MIIKLISSLITVAVCFGIGAVPNLVNRSPDNRDTVKTVRIAEPVPSELTEDEALRIALDHADLTADDVSRICVHKDRDDGVWIYEVEFSEGRTEYDYDIRVSDGKIVDIERGYDD